MADADAVALAGGDVLTPWGLCAGVGDAVAVQATISTVNVATVNSGTSAIRMDALTGTALRSMAGSSLLAG
jgi:hypothetical protein